MRVSRRCVKMKLIVWFCVISLVGLNQASQQDRSDVDVLIKNLFDNLAADPYLRDMEKAEFEQYVDNQVANFLHFFKPFGKKRGKRSLFSLEHLDELIEDKQGVYKLNGIEAFKTIPAKFPKDIELFKHGKTWFATVLESSGPNEAANHLKIYVYKSENFEEIASIPTTGVDLAINSGENATLIAVARNSNSKNLTEKSAIYQYSYGSQLKWIQNITESFATSAAFWNYGGHLYLAVAQSQPDVKNDSISKDLKTTIYKWAGRHFDIVQKLDTKYAQKVTPFKIKSKQYLGIANFQDETGDPNTYSDIYKFDVHSERFYLHQRINTQACTDVKFFSFKDEENRLYEDFLVVANSFKQDTNGEKNYLTESIIYKFVEDHFIPFQSIKLSGLEQWVPIEGPNGEFSLMASCKFDGSKFYQYDGWSFVETGLEFTSSIFKKNVNSLQYTIFDDIMSLVISNGKNDGTEPNMFMLNFKHENRLSQFHMEMLKWCIHISEYLDKMKTQERDISNRLIQMKNKPKKITESSASQTREARAQTQEKSLKSKNDPEKIQSLAKDLLSYKNLLDSVENSIDERRQPQTNRILDRNLTANNIIVHGEASIVFFDSDKINSVIVKDLLDNTINIHTSFKTNSSMEFEHLLLAKLRRNPKLLNNHPLENILFKNDLEANSLTIVGNIIVQKNLHIDGSINNMKFNAENILLKTGNQNFSRANLTKHKVKIDNLETKTLNNYELKNETCKNIETLKTKDLSINDGFINDINFKTLNAEALRTSGNQTIEGSYTFENLQADKIKVKNLLNGEFKPSDLINTKHGKYEIKGNLNFEDHLIIDNLTLKKRLNNINVIDDKLDILLKKSEGKQVITGLKRFENLTLMSPVLLNGAFIEPGKSKINPVINVYEDIEILTNLTINGMVMIEELLKVFDIVTDDGQYSVQKLLSSGLELEEEKIQLHLTFSQQPNVANIFADKVNSIDPDTWVVNGGKETQKIVGHKTFLNDLTISGGTTVRKINNIDVQQLARNVLKTDSDQEITATYFVEDIFAKSITTNQTLYAGKELKDLVDTMDLNQTAVNNLKASTCSCQNLTVNGLINRINFTNIIEDTVKKEQEKKTIEGHRTFKKLKCKNLSTNNQSPEDIFMDPEDVKEELIVDSDLNLQRLLVIHNINFTEYFNRIKSDEIADVKKQQITLGTQTFEKITVFGRVQITSNCINNFSIGALANDTIKKHEDLKLDTLRIAGSSKSSNIKLEGQIQGLDLENTVSPASEEEQMILNDKIFSNDVVIKGNVKFNGPINGMEQNRFLSSVSPNPEKEKIIVKGNVTFEKGPVVHILNGHVLDDLAKRVWFKDFNTIIKGNMNFKDVVFEKDISVEGLVDKVDLLKLSKRYFSKTKNQTISNSIEFGDVTFEENVTTPYVDLHGRINEIKLNELERTVLLDDVDQIFEDTVFMENCQAEDAKGYYTVNSLDLENDIMRYDKRNVVTGKKNISFLDVDKLKIRKDIKIQNINILETLENTVLRNVPANVTGKKIFTDKVSFYKNLSVYGYVNEKLFNSKTVMMKDVPQNISGKKTIVSSKIDPTEFKSVKLKGLVNNVDLQEVIKVQVNKNEDNVFESPINFQTAISVKNLNVEKSYHGVNVTKLLSDINTLNALANYEDIYSSLLNKATKLYHSLQNQAYYLHYYKVVGNFKYVDVMPITYENNVDALVTFKNETGTAIINFYQWDDAYNMYNSRAGYNISQNMYPSYITKLKVYHKDCLYMEYPLKETIGQDFSHTGVMYDIDGYGRFIKYAEILSKKVRDMSVVMLPGSQEICLVYVYDGLNHVYILCDIGGKKYQLHQSFLSVGVVKVTTVTVDGIPHIIVINQQNQPQMSDSTVNIWKFSLTTRLFHPYQTIHDKSPTYVDTVLYNGEYYLAIASGELEKAVHAGAIYIRRYQKTHGYFEPWQILTLEALIEVKFAILPSDELVLYATTKNPSKPFVIYMYEGISGFVPKVTASAIEEAGFIKHFTNQAGQHFILTGNEKEVNVIQAVFKGKKWTV